MTRKDGKPPYGEDSFLYFDETFFTDKTGGIVTKVQYSGIDKIAVGNKAIYIYTDAMKAIPLPFSVFETEEQRAVFLEFIEQKMKTAKENSQ